MMKTFSVRNDRGETFEVDENRVKEAEADGYLPVVSNGQQEHRVSFSDLSLAEKDGYRPIAAAPSRSNPDVESGDWFGPGGTVPKYLSESPNARALVQGTLDLLPAAGSIAGGSLGAAAGAIEGVPTLGTASIPLAAAQGVMGAGLGAGAGKSIQNIGERYLLGRERSTAETLLDPVKEIPTGMMGEALGQTLPVVAKTVLPAVGKRAMSTVLGPSTEAITVRLARPEQVRNAKSVEQIKDLLDESMSGLFKAVEDGHLSKQQAKEALSTIDDQIRSLSQEGSFQFRIKQADINDALKSAQAKLDRSFAFEKEKLTSIKSPIHLADDVQAALQEAKKQVGKLSSEAYEILGAHPHPVSIQEPFREIGRAARDMDIAGAGPLTDEAIEAQKKLFSLADRVGKMPVNIPATEAKKAIQQLDNAIDYGIRSGAFTGDTQKALVGLRRGLDGQLKQVPGYAEKMAEASNLSKMLEQASDQFGTPQAAVSKLNQIAGRTAGRSRDTLGALGSVAGRDFLSPVDEFVSAQNTLRDPTKLEAIQRSLPEWKELRLQQMAKAEASRPEAPKEFVQGLLNSRNLPAQREAAEQALTAATKRLTDAETVLEPFKSFSQGGTQNAITGLMKAPGKENIELRRKMAELGNRSGRDFLQMIDDRRIASAFEGEFRQGSRNVNLGTAFGASVGSLLMGAPGAAAGGIVGGTSGALIDKFGPKIAGKIIDGLTKVTGPIGSKEIMQLDVPQPVKSDLMKMLIQINNVEKSGSGQALRKSSSNELDRDSSRPANYKEYPDGAKNEPPVKGERKWLNDGVKKLEQHGAGDMSEFKEAMLASPKGKRLLIAASDLKPGSRAMDRVLSQIKTEFAKEKN